MIRLLLWPVLVPSVLFAMAASAVSVAHLLAALELGANPATASLIVAATGVVALLSTWPAGMLIDRFGQWRMLRVSAVVTFLSAALTSLVLLVGGNHALIVFSAVILLGVPGQVLFGITRMVLVADFTTTLERGRAMTALGGAQRAGALIGPLIGALLLVWLPIWSVYVCAALCVLGAYAVMLSRRLGSDFAAEARSRQQGKETEQTGVLAVRWSAVITAALPLMLLSAMRRAQPIVVPLWGLHLEWHESQILLLLALGSALELALLPVGGYLKDVVGRSFTLWLCLTLFGAGYLLAWLLPTGWGFIAAVAVMSLGNGVGAGINMTIGADLSPENGRARFLSLWSLPPGIASAAAPAVIAALLSAGTLITVLAACGVVSVAAGVWSIATQPITKLPTGRDARRRVC